MFEFFALVGALVLACLVVVGAVTVFTKLAE